MPPAAAGARGGRKLGMRGVFETHGWVSLQIATACGRGSAHLTAATSNPRASLALRKTPQSGAFLPDRGGQCHEHWQLAQNGGRAPTQPAAPFRAGNRQHGPRKPAARNRQGHRPWLSASARLGAPGKPPQRGAGTRPPFESVGKSPPRARMKAAYPTRALPYLCPEYPLCLCLGPA
jgi:hypothetical protein